MARDPNFQITPCSALMEHNELKFHGLYLFQLLSGPNQNQVFSVTSKGDLGSIVVFNWVVRDGPCPDATIIARAQGLHVKGGNWHNSFSLVFQNGRFKGSTLQVMGIPDPPIPGEWAIVGGTGGFSMATGVIKKREHEVKGDTRIIELTIHGFCPVLKDPKTPATKVGLWGGNEGTAQDVNEVPNRLERITIRSGFAIDAIEFSYVDQSGHRRTEGPWGGNGGTSRPVDLGSFEIVKELSGTYDRFNGVICLTSLKLVTSERTIEPWGLAKGTSFCITAPTGSAIMGFYGRGGQYLNAIGVYLKSL